MKSKKKLTISLIEPQIPPNTGNIARLCATNDFELHLVGKLGFDLSDKYLKRSGMDYWNYVKWQHFNCVQGYFNNLKSSSIHLLTSKSKRSYTSRSFNHGDILIFGSETSGLSEDLLNEYHDRSITIPMLSSNSNIRCLNLSTCVGIVSYEALRQFGFLK